MNLDRASTPNILADLRYLTESIGVRLAGSTQETATVDFLCKRFRENSANAAVETFPTAVRDVTSEALEIELGGRWQAFPASLYSSVPGTAGPGPVLPSRHVEPQVSSLCPTLPN